MDNYVLTYRGNRKISAIRSVRTYTGVSLKKAKEAIERSHGFIVSEEIANYILRDYLLGGVDATLTTMMDWSVKCHSGNLPLDLRGFVHTHF